MSRPVPEDYLRVFYERVAALGMHANQPATAVFKLRMSEVYALQAGCVRIRKREQKG